MVIPQTRLLYLTKPSSLPAKSRTAPLLTKAVRSLSRAVWPFSAYTHLSAVLPTTHQKVRAISSSVLSGMRDLFPTSVHREIKTLPHISSCSGSHHQISSLPQIQPSTFWHLFSVDRCDPETSAGKHAI